MINKEGRHIDGYLHFYEGHFEKKNVLYPIEPFELHGYFRERHAERCTITLVIFRNR